MVSEDDCEDRDNGQPRHEARGQCVSAGQVRPPHYQLGRRWNISLRGLYFIITCLSEDTIWYYLHVIFYDIVLTFLSIYMVNFCQFFPVIHISWFGILWKQWLWSMMTRIISNVLAKRPLTAHNYLPGRKWWCFLLSSILSFFVGVFSVLFIRACAAVFCRKVKISLKKMWNHSKCFNSIWNILIKFLLSKCIYIEVKS